MSQRGVAGLCFALVLLAGCLSSAPPLGGVDQPSAPDDAVDRWMAEPTLTGSGIWTQMVEVWPAGRRVDLEGEIWFALPDDAGSNAFIQVDMHWLLPAGNRQPIFGGSNYRIGGNYTASVSKDGTNLLGPVPLVDVPGPGLVIRLGDELRLCANAPGHRLVLTLAYAGLPPTSPVHLELGATKPVLRVLEPVVEDGRAGLVSFSDGAFHEADAVRVKAGGTLVTRTEEARWERTTTNRTEIRVMGLASNGGLARLPGRLDLTLANATGTRTIAAGVGTSTQLFSETFPQSDPQTVSLQLKAVGGVNLDVSYAELPRYDPKPVYEAPCFRA